MDPETYRRLVYWIVAYTQATQKLETGTINAVLRLLATLTGNDWYSKRATDQFVSHAVHVSQTGQQAIEGLANQYVGNYTSTMDDKSINVRPTTLDPYRRGADPTQVYTRPIEVFRHQIAIGETEQRATELAFERATQLVDTDMTLTRHDAEVKQMVAQGHQKYRRVLHPELSTGGTCGLCIAASTRVYNTSELMPLNGRCKCTVAPLAPGIDAGDLLNEQDLGSLYEASGGTSGPQLKRTRYQVDEHGEYGLVLARRGDQFRGPKDLGKNDPIGRAVKELGQLERTLTLLEEKAARGQNVAGPLAYQRDRIAYLQRIITAA